MNTLLNLDLCDFCSMPCLIHALAYMTELGCMYRELAEHNTSIRPAQLFNSQQQL